MTNKLRLRIKATTEGVCVKVRAGKIEFILDEGKHMGGQDLGPNPLQSVLGALAACENGTARMIAREMNFDIEDISFEINGQFDPRGFMGDPSVRPYFDTVTGEVKVKTNESEERLKELQKKVESRCPVFTMLEAANIEMINHWLKA